jgi:uncharacterized protein
MPDMDYTIVQTSAVDEQQMPTEPGAINGGMMKRSQETPYPVITIKVASIDEVLKQVEANGGSTVQAKTDIPGMGSFAYFEDCDARPSVKPRAAPRPR